MGITPNLGLSTYDTASGSATTFLTFRLALAGNSSNMTILDSFLGEVSGSIIAIQSNLLVNVNASLISPNYYEATESEIESYALNSMIALKLNSTNTDSVTLNINGLGIITLKKLDPSSTLVDIENGELKVDRHTLFVFDGTYYVLMGTSTADQISISGTEGYLLSVSGSGTIQESGISGSSILFDVEGTEPIVVTSGSVISIQTGGVLTTSGSELSVITGGVLSSSGSELSLQRGGALTTSGSELSINYWRK